MKNYALHQAEADGFAPGAANLGTLYRNWQARRSVRKLRDLDDHMLHDMGLTRTDVDLASHQPLTRNPTLFLETRMRG